MLRVVELQGKYQYIPRRGEWMAVIFEKDDDGSTHILDVGCEATEVAIQKWISDAIRDKPWIKGNPAVPDMYDRTH
jgi:hypothetical protein